MVINDIKPTQQALDGLNEAFATLDKQREVQNTKYIAGDELSIADFSVTATVTSWGYFLPNWENDYPNVKAYIDRMKQKDWFEANAEGLEGFNGIMTLKLKQFE